MKNSSLQSLRNVLACVTVLTSLAYAAEKPIPDFTKGEKLVQEGKEPLRERLLGPTGLSAMMYSKGMAEGATRLTRQFLISKVDAKSPA